MKILITGSRDWKDGKVIERALADYANYDSRYDVEFIHGGAQGADLMGSIIARRFGWKVTEVKADWDAYGKAAGGIRNQQMVDMQPDVVLAFQKDNSRGTQDCMDRAKKAGIPVVLVCC